MIWRSEKANRKLKEECWKKGDLGEEGYVYHIIVYDRATTTIKLTSVSGW